MQPDTIVGGHSWRKALRQLAMQCGPTLSLAIVMRTKRSLQETESIAKRRQAAPKRIGNPCLKPTEPSGTDPTQHDALSPCCRKRLVQSVDTPYREHICRASTANVNHVLTTEEVRQIGMLTVKEGQMRWRTT